MKIRLRLIALACSAMATASTLCADQPLITLNEWWTMSPSNVLAEKFSVTDTESWKSARVLPTISRLIYNKPVLESEIGLEYQTDIKWPQTIRLAVFSVNPLDDGSLFAPPAGEVDYMFGFGGRAVYGINVGALFQYNDFGSVKGATVGDFGDSDFLRFRLRLDRPFAFKNGIHTITPVLTYYHLEPYTYRPHVRGDVVSPEIRYDWQPYAWLKAGVNGGVLRNYGASGGIPATITAYGATAGVRLCPRAWVNVGVQQYDTLGSPANVMYKDFILYTANVSFRF